MDTNKVLRICGIVCLLCGLLISGLVFTDGEASTYSKIIGPLQVVVGVLFLITSRRK